MINELEDNKIKYLVMAAFFVALIILIKEIILKPQQTSLNVPQILSSSFSSSKIDFELLKGLKTGGLSPFYEISLPKEKGREDPFSEY
ncbi:hypothetical protein KKA09_03405 [Patescibacteria group bacterium]|nr:hypothetical protein [Patescibacteria group bacterium]